MTITQLAKKHNLDPESAKAFLREWLDMQPCLAYEFRSHELLPFEYPSKEYAESFMKVGLKRIAFGRELIARPDLED